MLLKDKDWKLMKFYMERWTACESWFIPEDQPCGIENCPYHSGENNVSVNETDARV